MNVVCVVTNYSPLLMSFQIKTTPHITSIPPFKGQLLFFVTPSSHQ